LGKSGCRRAIVGLRVGSGAVVLVGGEVAGDGDDVVPVFGDEGSRLIFDLG
jgi:hypothetical protein